MRILQRSYGERRACVSVLIVGLMLISLACGPASDSASQKVDPVSTMSNAAGVTPVPPGLSNVDPVVEASVATEVGTPARVDFKGDAPVALVDATEVGSNIGNHVPEFMLLLADESVVKSAELVKTNRPTFLYFFSTG